MRSKLLCLFSVGVLSACSFQVDVLEPQPSQMIEMTSSPPTTIAAYTLTATPPPFQSDASASLTPAAAALSTFPPPSIIPIEFSANASSQLVVGSVLEGSSQTYSLNALQGQVMSVSILPEEPEYQDTFRLEIRGSDGVVLCPLQDFECTFWRGVLPSTQEYFITVIPQLSGVFSMQIAINPAGTVSQTFDYADPDGRFELSYPDDFAPAHFRGAEVTKIPPEFSLQYIDTQQYVSTNLSEVYFLVGVSDDPQVTVTCTQPFSLGGPETVLGDTRINEVDFTKSQGGGVAAGNIYEQVYYRTLYNGSCYEVTYFIHYGNIGAYAPGTVEEFDRTALYQELDEILATLTLK